jgi:hypothetical protein
MWGEVEITKIPEEAKIAWGARAIKECGSFTLLPDRQGLSFSSNGTLLASSCPPELKASFSKFKQWINKKALAKGRKWVKSESSDSSELFQFDDEKLNFHYRATCYRSYGYVYMTAWFK